MINTIQLGNESEFGTSKIVVMHRPGQELDRLRQDNIHKLHFDEVPDIRKTHQLHDIFAQYLRDHGTQVLYVTELLLTTLLHSVEARYALIEGIIENSSFNCDRKQDTILCALREWLLGRTPGQLVEDVIAGVTYSRQELGTSSAAQTLLQVNPFSNEFVIPPLPNLLFTRDAFSVIEQNVFIWQMAKPARHNEPLIFHIIFQYHPQLSTSGLRIVEWQTSNNNKNSPTIEGGDVSYLGDGVLLISYSERTNRAGIEALAYTNLFRLVIAVVLPPQDDYMHLDTILSSVSKHAFTLHNRSAATMEIFTVEAHDINQNMYDKPQWVSHGCDIRQALRTFLNDNELKFYDTQDEETSIVEQEEHCHNMVTYNTDDIMRKDCKVELIQTHGLFEGCGGAHSVTNAIHLHR